MSELVVFFDIARSCWIPDSRVEFVGGGDWDVWGRDQVIVRILLPRQVIAESCFENVLEIANKT